MDTMKDTTMQPATDAVIDSLRKVIADCYWPTSPVTINEILDRLEAAEKDVALKEQVIDALGSELNAVAKERDALRNEIAYVKEVEFPRKAQAVADAWKGKCKRLEVERDALRAENAALVDDMNLLRNNNTALRSKIEAAENDAAHQKALAASALRVAEGWERKCGELRAKVAEIGQQELVAEIVSFGCHDLKEVAWKKGKMPALGSKLYAIPGAHPAPSVPDGWKEGVEAAARLIDQKAERYANRFGIDDVGGLSFGQGPHAEIKMDHYTSMIELADEVRAMLAARARMSVPEGWKLVPIEPTPTMVKAGLESSHVLNVHRVLVCYDAMIDAAPEAKP